MDDIKVALAMAKIRLHNIQELLKADDLTPLAQKMLEKRERAYKQDVERLTRRSDESVGRST